MSEQDGLVRVAPAAATPGRMHWSIRLLGDFLWLNLPECRWRDSTCPSTSPSPNGSIPRCTRRSGTRSRPEVHVGRCPWPKPGAPSHDQNDATFNSGSCVLSLSVEVFQLLVPAERRAVFTVAGDALGWVALYSAAAPATCGLAIEVPEIVL